MACINPNSPEFKEILLKVNNPLLAEIEMDKSISTNDTNPTDSNTSALENKLIDGFLKDFNITATEYESLKTELGIDAYSMSDLITKSIAYEQGESILPEVAYFAYSMLGKQNSKLRSELKYLVNKWDKYKERFEYHKNIILQEEGFIDNKKQWQSKVRDLVILDFLNESINLHYTNPQQFTKQLDSKWTYEDFTLWNKIVTWIEDLLSSYSKKYKNRKEKLVNIGISIADEILNQNYEYFDYNIKEGQLQKYYTETINKDAFAKEFTTYCREQLNFILTGSLALRKAGSVYRTVDENIHDIDYVIPYELTNTSKNKKYLDSIRNHTGEDVNFSSLVTMENVQKFDWYKKFIAKYPTYKIINGFYGEEHGNFQSYTLTGVIDGEYYTSNGRHEEEVSFYRKDPVTKKPIKIKKTVNVNHKKGDLIKDTGYVVDFFIRLTPNQEEHTNYFKLWKEIMIAKLKMGRDKDFIDWKMFVPFLKSKDKFNFNYEGFRHINYKKSESNAFEEIANNNTSSVNNPTIQEAKTWIKSVMSDANIELVNELVDDIGIGSYDTIKDLITLSEKYADKKTAKHEVFHRAFNSLSKEKQEELLEEGSKLFAIPRGASKATKLYQLPVIKSQIEALENEMAILKTARDLDFKDFANNTILNIEWIDKTDSYFEITVKFADKIIYKLFSYDNDKNRYIDKTKILQDAYNDLEDNIERLENNLYYLKNNDVSVPVTKKEVENIIKIVLKNTPFEKHTKFLQKNTEAYPLIANLINYYAKSKDSSFYEYKPLILNYIAFNDERAWSRGDGILYVETPEGQVSFHVFENEDLISYARKETDETNKWTEINTQSFAVELLDNYLKEKGLFTDIEVTPYQEYDFIQDFYDKYPTNKRTISNKYKSSTLNYTGDLAIEEKLAEMMENTPDEKLPKSVIGKWIQSVRNFFRNLFKERDKLRRFMRDINQGRYANQKSIGVDSGKRYSQLSKQNYKTNDETIAKIESNRNKELQELITDSNSVYNKYPIIADNDYIKAKLRGLTYTEKVKKLVEMGVLASFDQTGTNTNNPNDISLGWTTNRPIVMVRFGDEVVPFYRSSKGNSGKESGRWYNFFGFGEDGWLIKADIATIKRYYDNPFWKKIGDLLTEVLDYDHELDKKKGQLKDFHPLFMNKELALSDKNVNYIVHGVDEYLPYDTKFNTFPYIKSLNKSMEEWSRFVKDNNIRQKITDYKTAEAAINSKYDRELENIKQNVEDLFEKDTSLSDVDKLFKDKPDINSILIDDVYEALGLNSIDESEISYTDDDGNSCASKGGRNSKFQKGGSWEIIKEFKGKPHSEGGINIEINKGAIKMTNKQGDFEAKFGLVISNNN